MRYTDLKEKFTNVGSSGVSIRKGSRPLSPDERVSNQTHNPDESLNKWFEERGWNVMSSGSWGRAFWNPRQPMMIRNQFLKQANIKRGEMAFNDHKIYYDDVADRNIMWRGDVPVFTDPMTASGHLDL